MGKYFDEFIANCKKEELNINYINLHIDTQLVEEYNRIGAKTRLNTWSVSKSFVAIAAGIAIDEGLITLDEKVCDSFLEYLPEGAPKFLTDLTVRNLLMMTAGTENSIFYCDYPDRYVVKDWISHFCHANFVREGGKQFQYGNFNTYMIGCLIEKKSGENLLNYLRYRLFEPIGIGNPDWTLCPKGHCHSANGLYVNIEELSAFGNLILNKGVANGKRIVSQSFIEEATSNLISTAHWGKDDQYWLKNGYGYFFWINPDGKSFRAEGIYGQYCIIIPEKRAVLSVMGLEGNYNRVSDRIFRDIIPLI